VVAVTKSELQSLERFCLVLSSQKDCSTSTFKKTAPLQLKTTLLQLFKRPLWKR